MSSAPDLSVASLEEELAALQVRQLGLLQALRDKQTVDPELMADAEKVFAQLPVYIARLQEVRSNMDGISARTTRMRLRCEQLRGERPSS